MAVRQGSLARFVGAGQDCPGATVSPASTPVSTAATAQRRDAPLRGESGSGVGPGAPGPTRQAAGCTMPVEVAPEISRGPQGCLLLVRDGLHKDRADAGF